MKRKEFIANLKRLLREDLREMYSGDDESGDLTERLLSVQSIETVGDAFRVMRDFCYDIESAIATALSAAIEDVRDNEFHVVPPGRSGGWST